MSPNVRMHMCTNARTHGCKHAHAHNFIDPHPFAQWARQTSGVWYVRTCTQHLSAPHEAPALIPPHQPINACAWMPHARIDVRTRTPEPRRLRCGILCVRASVYTLPSRADMKALERLRTVDFGLFMETLREARLFC